MRYTIKRCPNCQKIVESVDGGKDCIIWGSPFKVCGKCGSPYVDPQYKEPALKSLDWYIERQKRAFDWLPFFCHWIATLMTPIFAIFVVGSFSIQLSVGDTKDYIICFLVSVLVLIGSKKASKSVLSKRMPLRVNKKFLKTYRESENRLRNPEFRKRLLSLGADVYLSFPDVK